MADFAQALGGFSAGLQGNLPQFQQVQNQTRQLDMQQQEMDDAAVEKRQATYFMDSAAMLNQLAQGNVDGVLQLGLHRLEMLKGHKGVDNSHTRQLVQLAVGAKNGDQESAARLAKELQANVELGKAYGIIKPEKAEVVPNSAISPTGQMVTIGPDGKPTAQSIAGYTQAAEKSPESFRALEMRAQAAGLKQGTPEYAAFMQQGGPAEGFEMITPDMAAQLGLPADKQFQRNKQTQQVSQVGAGPAVQVNTGTATEGERTAGTLASRLDFAQSQINDILAEDPNAQAPGAVPSFLSSMGLDYLARVSNPTDRQIIEAAQDDMLDAALTLGTGAAYTKEQLSGYRRSYFPQLGDDKKTIDSKGKRLKNLIEGAYKKAGRAAPEQKLSDTPTQDDNDPLGILK